MASVNVNREVEDQFYRYKMPKIIAKVEGKGNGIKTVIVNMPEVGKALDRPATYPCKYFGCELGAQVQFDLKNDRYIVNGSHESSKLQDLLDGFIKKFVLCQGCDNPETKLVVQAKKGMIVQRCAACGHQGDIDMRHKFTTYILKNPPNQDQSSATPSKKQTKKDKKKGSDSGESPEAGQGDTNGQITPPDDGFEDDVDWGEDVSEQAVKQRLDEITGAARSMTLSDDLEKTQTDRINILYEFVKARKDKMNNTLEKEIMGEAERLDIKEKAPLILAELLYDQGMVSQIKQFRTLFLRFTFENGKAQKYLLGAFEQLVANEHKAVLMPKIPHILKAFYDNDIIDEEIFLDWAKKPSKKYVGKEANAQIQAKAAPFIQWLSQAEEESSEGEEEEDELRVDFSRTEKVGVITIEKPVTKDTAAAVEEDEDFIDDI